MADLDSLLASHQPVLRYDRHEIYFADSAAVWTDCPGNVLRRFPAETAIAEPPALRVSFLGARTYADGQKVDREDLIACPTKNYVQLAREMHRRPGMANRAYGRSVVGSDRRVWLQYWFFYFYNDYELLGGAFPAGLHEGDWETVQLRLDEANAAPELALYAQHKGAEALWWEDVQKVGERPVVYVARGSHAAYFSAGRHWQGHWWDHADGKGFSPPVTLEIVRDGDPAYAWVHWPGLWGDTKPNPDEVFRHLDATSPRGPGAHAQWRDPRKLLEVLDGHESYEVGAARGVAPTQPVVLERAPAAPGAPAIQAARTAEGRLRVSYEVGGWPEDLAPRRLVVTANAPHDPAPPTARSVEIDAARGDATVPIQLDRGQDYEVHASIAGELPASEGAAPLTSDATTSALAAAGR